MKNILLLLALCTVLSSSCQKGRKWNRLKVEGIVEDGNGNPLSGAQIWVHEEGETQNGYVNNYYRTYSNEKGEYKVDAINAMRDDDFYYSLNAGGPGPSVEYKSMNWRSLDTRGDIVVLKKGANYKIRIVFR